MRGVIQIENYHAEGGCINSLIVTINVYCRVRNVTLKKNTHNRDTHFKRKK